MQIVSYSGQKVLLIKFYVKINIGDILMVQYKRIIDLREDRDYAQEHISKILNVSRSSYANWENGDNKIPLEILDKLSIFYNVSFSYLLDIKNKFVLEEKICPIDYEYFYDNLINLKKKKFTYQEIAIFLNVTKSTAYKYYVGQLDITVDILILLSKLNDIDIDKLCGKIK